MGRFVSAIVGLVLVTGSVLAGPADVASAATTCTFSASGTTMTLDADCTTDQTIVIPAGFTLNGNGKAITAVDPTGGHFTGAVVANGGATAHVRNLTVRASGLANVCDAGAARLRGIMFERASGSITHSTVLDINQGPSGCQEGNAIEVRNVDPSPAPEVSVEIAHNTILRWQKTGIVANGDVNANVHHNVVGPSATQANLAANSVQLGFGARGVVAHNKIAGNSWSREDAAATGILLILAEGAEVSQNQIDGNADVGIYISASSQVNAFNNRVSESGPDGAYDIGIGNYSDPGNTFRNNKVSGYDTPFDNVEGKNNQVKRAKPHE